MVRTAEVLAKALRPIMTLLLVVAVIALVLMISERVQSMHSRTAMGTIELPVRFYPQDIGVQESQALGRSSIGATSGTARVACNPWVAFVLGVLRLAFYVAALWAFLALLRDLFLKVAAGEPFTEASVRQVRLLGIGIMAFYAAKAVLGIIAWLLLVWGPTRGGIELYPGGFDVGGLFLGAVVILLAEVFRHGAVLQTDSELTI